MTRQARRNIVTTIVAVVALSLVSLVVFIPRPPRPGQAKAPQTAAAPTDAAPTGEADGETPAHTDGGADAGQDDTSPAEPDASPPSDPEKQPAIALEALRAIASPRGTSTASDPNFAPTSLGSLDREAAKLRIDFSTTGAGMSRITLSDVWETVQARLDAARHDKAVAAGRANPPPMPPDDQRYVLVTSRVVSWIDSAGRPRTTAVPALAAHSIIVNGTNISLANAECWSQVSPGVFESVIVNGAGEPVLTITRTFALGQAYDLTLDQRLTSHADRPLEVIWRQYGPGDLFVDRARYIDRRRFRIGYLFSPQRDPSRSVVELDDEMLFERTSIQRQFGKLPPPPLTAAQRAEREETLRLWPNETSIDEELELSIFAATNRYFALAVHPRLAPDGSGPRMLTPVVGEIVYSSTDPESDVAPAVMTYFYSPAHTIEPGQTLALDLGIYAGPQDREVLGDDPKYQALNLSGLILYQMSSFCAICTFQWLARLLLMFLALVDAVFLDWGVAIILLVLVVRVILHPITKKSQVNMRLFAEQMQAIKPELDKLQQKYAGDPKKLQAEQVRFMREHNMNPVSGALGCLPMFLQTPIWIALYAMLFFAYDLRHEPAFYGLFQLFAGWPFLADLSAADHFFGEFAEPKRLFGIVNLTGLNMLPLLMGVIFWIQQKYMTPTTTTLTPEQQTQQKIMKVMMIVLFPVMLYNAPSGLTLYILTSSTIGIIESKYIRAHISDMDLKKAVAQAKGPGRAARRAAAATDGGEAPGERRKKKPRDAISRAYTNALERAKEKARNKRKGPDRQFKKRKPE